MRQRKKRRFTLLFVPLLLCFSFSLLSCGKKPTGKIVGREVRVSYDFDNFPFTKEDEEGSATGFEVELIEAIAKREGFSVRFLPKNQSTLEPSVIAGTSDMAIGGLVEEKTEKRVDFSKSYQEMQLAFLLSRKNSGLFTEAAQDGTKEDRILEALRGKRIYVKEGSFAAAFLEERRENYGYFLTVVQTNEDFREALEGDADAICDFSPALTDIVKLHREFRLVPFPKEEELSFIVGHGQNQEILRAFARGLRKMQEDGSFESLRGKYKSYFPEEKK